MTNFFQILTVSDVLSRIYFHNTVLAYILAFIVLFVGLFIALIFKFIVLAKMRKLAKKNESHLNDVFVDVVDRAGIPLAYYGIFYAAVYNLTLTHGLLKLINIAGGVLFAISLIRATTMLVTVVISNAWGGEVVPELKERRVRVVTFVFKVVVWALGGLLLLDNLGINVTSLLAGLGIGGVAVAFASQAVLADLFSYVSIFLDRPFEQGDFVVSGELKGTVEHIGLKTTRLRGLEGEQIIVSNSELTKTRLKNFQKMEKRRIAFKLGVTYSTTGAQLTQIPIMIEKIIRSVPDTEFDRSHFIEFADSSLIVESVYFVLSNDYKIFLARNQVILLAIQAAFETEKIEFAFPTQTVHLQK